MRVFAERYPANVGGIVLVDATSEDEVLNIRGKLTRLRLLAKQRAIPEPRSLAASPPKPTTAEDARVPGVSAPVRCTEECDRRTTPCQRRPS